MENEKECNWFEAIQEKMESLHATRLCFGDGKHGLDGYTNAERLGSPPPHESWAEIF